MSAAQSSNFTIHCNTKILADYIRVGAATRLYSEYDPDCETPTIIVHHFLRRGNGRMIPRYNTKPTA